MKKMIWSSMAMLMMVGCEVNTFDNGVLDGFWQMTQIDTLTTGGKTDMRDSLVFWSVQANILETRVRTGIQVPVMFRFRLEDDKLYLSEPIANARKVSDSIVTSPATVACFGLSDLNESFDVKTLDAKKMVLESEHHLRLHFRKY